MILSMIPIASVLALLIFAAAPERSRLPLSMITFMTALMIGAIATMERPDTAAAFRADLKDAISRECFPERTSACRPLEDALTAFGE